MKKQDHKKMAVFYRGYAEQGETRTTRSYIDADVLVIINMEAKPADVEALLQQIIDENREDPVP